MLIRLTKFSLSRIKGDRRLKLPRPMATSTHPHLVGAVYTSQNGRFRFYMLSSSSAYRLADFKTSPMISQHQLASQACCVSFISPEMYDDVQGASTFLYLYTLKFYGTFSLSFYVVSGGVRTCMHWLLHY